MRTVDVNTSSLFEGKQSALALSRLPAETTFVMKYRTNNLYFFKRPENSIKVLLIDNKK